MPSLIPTETLEPVIAAALDLNEIFTGDGCKESLSRVISYLAKISAALPLLSWEILEKQNYIFEEFFIGMPTVAAYFSEVKLCQAIERHANGFLSDAEMTAVLTEYVAVHTFIYKDFNGEKSRELKAGIFELWTGPEVELFYLENADDLYSGQTLNKIQVYLFRLLNPNGNYKLERL